MVSQIKDDKAYFRVPYEMLPLPKKGDVWDAVNYAGEVIGKALIENVLKTKKQDRTAVVTAVVDKKFLYEFVTVRCPE